MNYKEITHEDVRALAERLCKNNGYTLLEIRSLPHPEDGYLKFVLAHSEGQQEYATWLLNVDMEGLAYGHYFDYRFNSTQSEAYGGALHYYQTRR